MIPKSVSLTVTYDDDSQATYKLAEIDKFHWDLGSAVVQAEPDDTFVRRLPTGFINIEVQGKLVSWSH